jgi:hypothetical protein
MFTLSKKERKHANSEGFAMARFDCARILKYENLSKEELIEKWTRTVRKIDEQNEKTFS